MDKMVMFGRADGTDLRFEAGMEMYYNNIEVESFIDAILSMKHIEISRLLMNEKFYEMCNNWHQGKVKGAQPISSLASIPITVKKGQEAYCIVEVK